MTPARAKAQQNIAAFLARLDDPEAPAPPHRVSPGRPPPDPERDLAAEAARIWHTPVERVEPSRDRQREAERAAGIPSRRKKRNDGMCPRCETGKRHSPKYPYCPGCMVWAWKRARERQRDAKIAAGVPVRKRPGRPRKTEQKRRRAA